MVEGISLGFFWLGYVVLLVIKQGRKKGGIKKTALSTLYE
jgi:hypothetical protein